MNDNEALINKFYSCFNERDYKGMQECYTKNATFTDAVFVNLNADELRSMWEMLCLKGKDLKIEFKNVSSTDNNGEAEWTAYYTFSASGKKVINHIKADFVFEEGLILKHIDTFSFYNWARQALGIPGILLGWTSFMKNKVRKAAMSNLLKFMSEPKAGKKTH